MNEKNDKEIIEVKEVEAERINREETFRPRFKRIRLSPLFLISVLIYVISGIFGLFICFTVVKDVFGPIIAFLGLIFFPFILTLAQWYRDWETDRKSTRLNSSHSRASRMPSSA